MTDHTRARCNAVCDAIVTGVCFAVVVWAVAVVGLTWLPQEWIRP